MQLAGLAPHAVLPLPARRRKQGRRQGRRRHDHHRRPHLQLLPAELPERKRPPAGESELPARLPRLRAGLAGRRERHPALSRRPQYRATRRAPRASPTPGSGRPSRTPAAARSTAVGDLYVATPDRTGWVTKYIGPPAKPGRRRRGPAAGAVRPGRARSSSATTRAVPARRLPGRTSSRTTISPIRGWTRSSTGTTARTNLGFRNQNADLLQCPLRLEAPTANSSTAGRRTSRPCRPGLNPYLEGGVNPGGMAALNCPEVRTEVAATSAPAKSPRRPT